MPYHLPSSSWRSCNVQGQEKMVSQLKERDKIHRFSDFFLLWGLSTDWIMPAHIAEDSPFTQSPDSNINLYWKHQDIMFYQLSRNPLAQSS